MDPRFTRGEYWLLETVVEDEFPIADLVASDLELDLDKKGHGLTDAALVETLHRLIASGFIYAKNEIDGFISTYEQLERALNQPAGHNTAIDEEKSTSYRLTPKGGAHWEVFAAPDWQKYVSVGQTFSDECEHRIWELMCADKAWLEWYVESFFFNYQAEVVFASIEWDCISLWHATYWKQLEGAHRVRFQGQDKTEEICSPPPSLEYFYRGWCAWQ